MKGDGETVKSNSKADGTNVLESVRRLESTLEGRRDIEEAASARLEVARAKADSILRRAREEAERDAAERRSDALSRADEEAERLLREAEAEAGMLRAIAENDHAAAAREVVALILPGRGV